MHRKVVGFFYGINPVIKSDTAHTQARRAAVWPMFLNAHDALVEQRSVVFFPPSTSRAPVIVLQLFALASRYSVSND
jgi:hypothetical protein